MKVSTDELAKAITDTLKEYADVTAEACDAGVKLTAKEAVEELRNANPEYSGEWGSWADYNKGWKFTQTKTDKRYHRGATIHNTTHYQLTHLLENGHALVNGERSRAFVHIAPVADKAEDNLLKNIKANIEKS